MDPHQTPGPEEGAGGRPGPKPGNEGAPADRGWLMEQLRTVNQRLVIASLEARQHAENAEAAQQRLAYLLEAGGKVCDSLDYERTVHNLCQVCVPNLADWCIVYEVDEKRLVRRVSVAHGDAGKADLAQRLREQEAPAGNPLLEQIFETGQPQLIPLVTQSLLRSVAQDSAHFEVLAQIAPHSAILVPLVARARPRAALVAFTAESGRRYGPDDAALVEELARRAALALDNACLYAQAQEASAAKDRFLAVLSHELRNPLSAILAGAHALKRVVRDEAGLQAVDIVERNARLQSRLVNDLLDVARIARGKVALKREPVNLNHVVRTAVQAQADELKQAGLRVHLQMDGDVWITGDSDRLQQVLSNLLTNARKFTPRGGEIRISIAAAPERGEGGPGVAEPPAGYRSSPGARVRLEVADTGAGIEPQHLSSIFDLFDVGAGPQSGPGLGIGLSLVKGIVERHGGRVWAESGGTGRGSRFVVDLPAIAAPPGR